MDIDIKSKKFLDQKVFNYPDKDIKWVNKNELRNFNFAPADEFIIRSIIS